VSVDEDFLSLRTGERTGGREMKRKRWTEKQLLEKIKEVKYSINTRKRRIKDSESELRDLEVLLAHYEKLLEERRNNPSSKEFGTRE